MCDKCHMHWTKPCPHCDHEEPEEKTIDIALHELVDRINDNMFEDPNAIEDVIFHWASENDLI